MCLTPLVTIGEPWCLRPTPSMCCESIRRFFCVDLRKSYSQFIDGFMDFYNIQSIQAKQSGRILKSEQSRIFFFQGWEGEAGHRPAPVYLCYHSHWSLNRTQTCSWIRTSFFWSSLQYRLSTQKSPSGVTWWDFEQQRQTPLGAKSWNFCCSTLLTCSDKIYHFKNLHTLLMNIQHCYFISTLKPENAYYPLFKLMVAEWVQIWWEWERLKKHWI